MNRFPLLLFFLFLTFPAMTRAAAAPEIHSGVSVFFLADESWPEEEWPEDAVVQEEETSGRVLKKGPALAMGIVGGVVGLGVGFFPGQLLAAKTGSFWGYTVALAPSIALAAVGTHLFSPARYHFELFGALAGIPVGALVCVLPLLPVLLASPYAYGMSILAAASLGAGVGAWYAAVADTKNKWRNKRATGFLPAA
ncbi:MAG: hypothetical protein HN348_09045, partial [Proteobacteria bacterium]|nr:hypothetical protein [Pseudomonadota bacterium]